VTPQPPRFEAVYRYWACDLRTGAKIAQLPLKPSGTLPDRMSDVATASFTCDQGAVWRDGGDFIGTTTPGRTVIVVEREYVGDSTSDILWAGIILPRDAGSDSEATLNCSTIPVYFNRRYPTNHSYSSDAGGTDGQILTDLANDAAAEGIGLILDIDCPTPRTWRYTVSERRSIFACWKDLADLDGGPEWKIVTRWADANRLAIQHMFVARPRLGWSGEPNVRLDFPGSVTKYVVHDDFTEGHGGNQIAAIGASGAASVPARDTQGITQQGWARWEENVTTSGALNAAGLAGAAKAALANRARGQVTVELELDMTFGPQYGRDWVIGDNALWFVAGPETPGAEPPSFRHPDGHSETIRAIGADLDLARERITPMLWSPYDETATA
jgi:hypothetical protein